MSTVETREQVLERVGTAIARRREESVVDGMPMPVLAEGTAPVIAHVEASNSPRRRLWPWAAGTAVVALVGTFGYEVYSSRAERAEDEARYPIVATAADSVVLDREAERWRAGRARLLANLAAFDAPAIESLTGVGACPVAKATPSAATVDDDSTIDPDAAIATQLILLPGEALEGLDVVARTEIDAMLAAADRGRFRTADARDHVLAALSGALVVARLHTFSHGVAAGTAYAFDPATGSLRCSGSFLTEADPSSLHDLTIRTEHTILDSLRGVSASL